MYNPFELSEKTERFVVDGSRRKYYRFRATKFYGGIATADAVGCNLRCMFCWSGNVVWKAEQVGAFYAAKQVADKLNMMAMKKGYDKVRVSGGEPTIGKEHLIALLEAINPHLLFILETNGILLGTEKNYVEKLCRYPNLHVRVCLKGATPEEFAWLTGADKGFAYQLKALENLRDTDMSYNIAYVSVSGDKQKLFTKLREMDMDSIMVEEEEITLYPPVRKRLVRAGMVEYFEH